MKGINVSLSSFFLILVILSSCIRTEELKEEMNQTFSIPIGEKELAIDAPTIIDNNSQFFYNGRPYLIVGTNFQKSDILEFEIDSISKNEIVQRVDFRVRFNNSYPVNAYVQVYLLNTLKEVTDSFFVSGMQKIPAGEVNSLDEPEIITTSVFDTEFQGDRLVRLKNAKYLSYLFYLNTAREDGVPLRFTNKSNINVNLAMRLYLKYKLSDT